MADPKKLPYIKIEVPYTIDCNSSIESHLENIKNRYLYEQYIPERTERSIEYELRNVIKKYKLDKALYDNKPLFEFLAKRYVYLGDYINIDYNKYTNHLEINYYDLYVDVKKSNKSIELIAKYGYACDNYISAPYDFSIPKEDNFCLRNKLFSEILKRYTK